ncbi:F-box/kelch-repeat protein At3g06240-like [Vicia villosa]|uniref:F-box/kelch-repeat protein At3g06240-like n=1 Tax=Vicia villosa TaxID=3911 RepID=UPI00273CCB53|nr:F-box/kelch-repeat protein At3g06240-like [Vicia villosa]
MAPTIEKVSNHVPEDIIFSIFSKLPLKSVHRFTCVRKSLTLLFQNPIFMNMFGKNMVSKYHSLHDDEAILLLNHFDNIHRQCKLYLLSDEKFESKAQLNWPCPFSPNYGPSNPHIVGSAINGILCICDTEYSYRIVLWNPATDELTRVPQSRAGLYHEYETHFVIHGFGYDHVKDDYKIIQRIVYIGGLEDYWQSVPSGPFWELYSFRNNSWKKINVDMRQRYLMSDEGVEVYLNGVCYWWGKTDHETYVVSFNLTNEMHTTTLFPFNLDDFKRVDRHLAVLNGHVAMILSYVKKTSPSFNISISVLGEAGVAESWTKLFEVRPLSCIEHPIGSGKKGNVFFRKDDDELACLDLSTGVVENIGIKAKRYYSQVVVYKKNFLSVGGMIN